MANQQHVDMLKQGILVWKRWKEEHPTIQPDLSEADLRGVNLREVDLSRVNLSGADLSKADLYKTNLSKANLHKAYFCETNFYKTNLREADLREADFYRADLSSADLSRADLSGADLSRTIFIKTNLANTNLTGCRIYGISVWDVHLANTIQKDLTITPFEDLSLPRPTLYPDPTLYPGKSEITIDNLEVAQFINLFLNNAKIRDVIDTITSKVVLLLGRFTDERKPVLDALREELRQHNFSPVIFDFDPSAQRDLTETISTLAHLSRFIIADLTDAKSIPQELQAIVPHLPSVPIQPILQMGMMEHAMFEHYERYSWVLPLYRYQDIPSLLASIKERIITPVEQKMNEKEKMNVIEEENRNLKERIRELEEGT